MSFESNQLPDEIYKYYHVIKPIAQGSFGKVYHCINQQTKKDFAVKVIDKTSVKRAKIQLLRTQAKILENVEHSNIVKMNQLRETQRHIYLEMEFIQYGTLAKIIRENSERQNLTINQIAIAMRAILSGVCHLHSLNIIHRDLKPCKFFDCDVQKTFWRMINEILPP